LTARHVVFLLADGGMEQLLRGFFERDKPHLRLGCGPFTHQVLVAPTKDPGVYQTARELLRPYEQTETHAVVMLDAQWEGSPGVSDIRERILAQLKGVWERHEVIVLDPELEVWFWRDVPELGYALNIPEQRGGRAVRELLPTTGPASWPTGRSKPTDPKAALEFLRRDRKVRADRSNAVFRRVGALSARGCTDPAYRLLSKTLTTWFPPEYGT